MDPTARVPSQSVPFAVRAAAEWSWRLLLLVLAVAVVVLMMSVTKVLWVPVVLALLLTMLLKPAVDAMNRRGVWRGTASVVAVLALVAAVGGLLALAGQQAASGFADLWDQAHAGFLELLSYLSSGPLGLDAAQLDDYTQQIADQLQSNSTTLLSGALSVTTTIGHIAAGTIITIFCLVFFLKDGAQIWTWLMRLLPGPARLATHEAGRRGMVTLGAFTRTQILVALIDALGIGLGALLLGVPLVLPLTVLVFLASFVPFVGAIATGAIAVLVALVDQGPVTALVMLAIVVAVQQVEGHLLQPFLLGHAVSVHPVAVLLAVTGGSLAAGIVGALLAVPLVATANTVVLYLHGHDKFPELGDGSADLERRLAELNGDEPEAVDLHSAAPAGDDKG